MQFVTMATHHVPDAPAKPFGLPPTLSVGDFRPKTETWPAYAKRLRKVGASLAPYEHPTVYVNGEWMTLSARAEPRRDPGALERNAHQLNEAVAIIQEAQPAVRVCIYEWVRSDSWGEDGKPTVGPDGEINSSLATRYEAQVSRACEYMPDARVLSIGGYRRGEPFVQWQSRLWYEAEVLRQHDREVCLWLWWRWNTQSPEVMSEDDWAQTCDEAVQLSRAGLVDGVILWDMGQWSETTQLHEITDTTLVRELWTP